jgi:hypothetical protein
MNIYKLLKPVLPAVMLISAAGFIAGCSSSSDDTSSGDTPAAPAVPLVGITGIWTGTFSWETPQQPLKEYDVTMMFHHAEGEPEGEAVGLALGDGPDDINLPHFLFEGGYVYSDDPIESDPAKDNSTTACEGGVWAVGRFGQQGTFVQEFSYVTGSAGGPDQRGAACLYLEDTDGDGYFTELNGEISFEEAGKFNVALTYSEDNVRDVAVTHLGVVGSDEGAYDASDDVKYHLWTNNNSGNFMTYNATYIAVGDISLTYLVVSEDHSDPVVDCGGLIVVSKIEGQNLFALRLPEESPVNGCTLVEALPGNTWDQDGKTYTAYDVDLPFYGLGALTDTDGDGNLEFIHMMGSKQSGAGSTSQVLYNRFIVQ